MKCKICQNEKNNTIYHAREMFFGTKEAFDYMECNECKCVQLMDIPTDMSPYYPSDYYTANPPFVYDFSSLERTNESEYIKQCLSRLNISFLNSINTLDCTFLDVGCGNAMYVHNLANMGIKRAVVLMPSYILVMSMNLIIVVFIYRIFFICLINLIIS